MQRKRTEHELQKKLETTRVNHGWHRWGWDGRQHRYPNRALTGRQNWGSDTAAAQLAPARTVQKSTWQDSQQNVSVRVFKESCSRSEFMQCRARGIESSPGCNTFTEKLVEDVQRQSTEGRGYKHIYENTRMTPSLMPCRSSERGKDVIRISFITEDVGNRPPFANGGQEENAAIWVPQKRKRGVESNYCT